MGKKNRRLDAVLIGCETLHSYIENSREIYKEIKSKRKFASYLYEFIYSDEYVKFVVGGIILREPEKQPIDPVNGSWFLLSQDNDELPVYADYGWGSMSHEENWEVADNSFPGDIVNVLLSPLRRGTLTSEEFIYSELLHLHNQSLSERLALLNIY